MREQELQQGLGGCCSTAVAAVGHLANSWNLPIITPVGNTEIIGDKQVYQRLTRLSRFMQGQFVDMMLVLMERYGWNKLVIFNDEATLFHQLTGITFDAVLQEKKHISWTRYAIDSTKMGREDYRRLLLTARTLVRVIVVLAQPDTSREFMLVAHSLGYTSGDFAYFAVANPAEILTRDIWQKNDAEDAAARQAYESVIFLQLAEDRVSDKLYEFQQTMINASLEQYNYTYDEGILPASTVLSYYESVMMYAHVLNETLAAGEDPTDGLEMTRKMWNRTFDGLAGPLVINEYGDRSSDIDIVDLNPVTGDPEHFETLLLYWYRRWRRMSEANLWWWKILPVDLTQNNLPLTGSLISIMSGYTSSNNRQGAKDDASVITFSMDTGIFKMRELAAPNLVRVLGACLDVHTPVLVTEFCPKGSLQDLLGSVNTVSLDAEFKISLANDIAQGLDYLHGSPVGHHGRLSSANCLIDNRFTVKLADYGLASLLGQERIDFSSQEYKRECLWKAPEVLRGQAPQSGTKEGDVYSFAIILSELITRASPYERETDYLTLDEILERLRRGGTPESFLRPSVQSPGPLSSFVEIMAAGWCEDPHLRPTATTIKKHIKNIALKSGQSANLLDNLLRRMERYANNLEKLVEEKTAELGEEKKKTEELLYQILPKDIANRLKMGLHVEPEQYGCVTIYFSDIVGFTTLSSRLPPIHVVDLLNDLYSAFDETISAFDVYKVETIGDAYMVVSGLPHRNGTFHAQQIARMSLALRNVISVFKIKHSPEDKLQLRIGLNSGPVCAGVVGLKMPRYCLFGDTVNTASRMESSGEGMKIHMSQSTTTILESFGTFDVLSRGEIEIKGKGLMTTFWLIGERPPATINPLPSTSQA
ncbi:atrial natriuretic peptide receptor 1-like [Littorina saxatilis]|uniref:atrial natriuretic peptide receptor 1-like n=1 Tax=Littorina saxatilis TaxID=31220 RepID=UPI0038B45A9C